MKVFVHHIYEYQKGLRNLVLHTLNSSQRAQAEEKLKQMEISYLIREVTASKINIFFGAAECVEVIRRFGNKQLGEFTPEEDFILGTMLGYDRLQQCRRYILMASRCDACEGKTTIRLEPRTNKVAAKVVNL